MLKESSISRGDELRKNSFFLRKSVESSSENPYLRKRLVREVRFSVSEEEEEEVVVERDWKKR